MKFNVNHKVRVRLTDRGRTIHASDHAIWCAEYGRSFPYIAPKEDADGWSEWQLWELMSAFGKHLSCGLNPVFETEIEIPTESLCKS